MLWIKCKKLCNRNHISF